uniref:Activator of Hsp90 ATPase AHSA1-like N-terminal domain-containing protein n=1 Tax=Quercus lobata TaxID=97700 RepID=A0A7N2MXN4_QUELO
MASEEAERKQEEQQGASYTYWVRQVKEGDAAPLPVPRKLTPDDIINDSNSQPPTLGSLWNKAGTWEEKNLHKWASDRIKELLISVGSLEFPAGKAEISDVSKCVGDFEKVAFFAFPKNQELLVRGTGCKRIRGHQLFHEIRILPIYGMEGEVMGLRPIGAFLVTVRNKKRVGYTYELTLKVKGEWTIREEKKTVKGHIDIAEFSFGELDDLQMEVRLSEEKDLLHQDKLRISQDLKLFLQPVREKMLQFEQELKDR